MTVPSETNKATYSGDGATYVFSTDFTFASNDEVTVSLVEDATSATTTWVEGSQYTLTGAGTGSAGAVTVVTSPTDYTPASGYTLVIDLAPDFTQPTLLPRGGSVSLRDTLEPMIDRVVRMCLRLKNATDRSLKVSDAESSISVLPTVDSRKNKFLGFDASGAPIASSGSVDGLAVSTFMETVLDDTTAAAARATLGALSTSPQLAGVMDTNGNLVKLSKGADTASATTVTIGTDGNYADLTGTTTVEGFAAIGIGTVQVFRATGVLTLTHHATNLILLGGANITTSAGDQFAIVEYDTAKWRMLWYTRAGSKPGYSENGTFTPTLYGSSTAGSPTLTSAAGNYVRISENLIQVQLRLAWTSLGSAAGDIRIGALPFTALGQTASNSGRAILSAARCNGLNLGSGYVLGAFVEANTTYISLVKSNNTASDVEVVETELSSSGEIYLTGTYQI